MRILTKSIIKETAFVTLSGFFIFTFFLIMNSLFVMSDLVIKYGVGLWNVIKLLFLLLPSTVAITVPMAFLVGVILTYSRLVQDNEFIGMQAAGISVRSITLPAAALGLALFVVMVLFNNYTLPAANMAYRELYYDIVKKRSGIIIQEHAFISDFDNYIFYIGDKDSKTDLLKNVIVFVKSKDNSSEPARVILAKEGEVISDEKTLRIALKLKDGLVQIGSYTDMNKMNQIFFDNNFIDLDIKGVLRQSPNKDDIKGSREMTGEELYAEIKKGKESRHDKNWLYIELYKKISIPFACIVFMVIGVPLGLMTRKGGRVIGIGFSLVLITVYYFALSIGQNMGYRGKLDHMFAVWLPNLLILGVGALLFAVMALPEWINNFKNRGKK